MFQKHPPPPPTHTYTLYPSPHTPADLQDCSSLQFPVLKQEVGPLNGWCRVAFLSLSARSPPHPIPGVQSWVLPPGSPAGFHVSFFVQSKKKKEKAWKQSEGKEGGTPWEAFWAAFDPVKAAARTSPSCPVEHTAGPQQHHYRSADVDTLTTVPILLLPRHIQAPPESQNNASWFTRMKPGFLFTETPPWIHYQKRLLFTTLESLKETN